MISAFKNHDQQLHHETHLPTLHCRWFTVGIFVLFTLYEIDMLIAISKHNDGKRIFCAKAAQPHTEEIFTSVVMNLKNSIDIR